MELLALREREIFSALKSLQAVSHVLIGGYAVNAYTFARFSIDCDIVVGDATDAEQVRSTLERNGFRLKTRNATGGPYAGFFMNFEKKLGTSISATFDVLVKEVLDRRTGVSFSSDWIIKNSGIRRLSAKTYPDSFMISIIDPDALVVMKLVAGRVSDLRDVFMLAPVVDASFVRDEIAKRMDASDAFARAEKTILSKQFRNNLQGVFGFVEEKVFNAHVEAFKKLADRKP